MARRKADAEVGPLGVWAYDTRDALDLSIEAVIAALPTNYHPATLRKVEGGSARPGARMWRELGNLYAKLADERRLSIDAQPRLTPDPPPIEEPVDLAAALSGLTVELEAMRRERLALWRGIQRALTEPEGERVAAALSSALASLLPEPAPR